MQTNRTQRGFVLILSLVMLAVLTLIGVSSMNSSNMELKATANAKQHQVAYSAATTLLEYSISKPVVQSKTINYQSNDPANFPVSISPAIATLHLTNASNLKADVDLMGCDYAIGSSLETGKSFSYSYFNVAGTAANLTDTTSKQMAQGVRYPAAACTN